MFPHLAEYADYALLFLRFVLGLVFVKSGYAHVQGADERSKSIELPKGVTIFLGIAEVLGGLGVIVGVFSQLAALGLILIMLGAIQKKAFVWKTGFWGNDGLGWNYEVILIAMLLVVACTNGGRFVLLF